MTFVKNTTAFESPCPPSPTITAATPSSAISSTDAAASVCEVMTMINSTLRGTDYSCKTVSWDDVNRGEVGGTLSCWGANITDTRLYEKNGRQLYTVRSNNFNEKLGAVSADELAIVSGNQAPGGGTLKPMTLADFLKKTGTEGSYAGLDSATDLSAAGTDKKVSIRFMTTFLPVADESLATLEFAPEMYQYQTRSENDPANLLLLATTQGVAVQANGAGATKLYHHAVEPGGKICRYWFEAERSTKAVGGAQVETKEEALEAASRGKATASVIGTRSMGTRFNVLMTVQVPLKQKPQPRPRYGALYGDGGSLKGLGSLNGSLKGLGSFNGSLKGGMVPLSLACGGSFASAFGGSFASSLGFAAAAADNDGDDDDDDWGMDVSQAKSLETSAPMRRCGSASAPKAAKVGRANAARVSRGSMVDKLDATVKVRQPVRDESQHVTVTVVLYNTVAGGVPSPEDVRAAVDDMEALYASCGWKGRLAEEGAAFMKKELTVKNALDIEEKLTTQPYVPPAGVIGLVQGGDIFPTTEGD